MKKRNLLLILGLSALTYVNSLRIYGESPYGPYQEVTDKVENLKREKQRLETILSIPQESVSMTLYEQDLQNVNALIEYIEATSTVPYKDHLEMMTQKEGRLDRENVLLQEEKVVRHKEEIANEIEIQNEQLEKLNQKYGEDTAKQQEEFEREKAKRKEQFEEENEKRKVQFEQEKNKERDQFEEDWNKRREEYEKDKKNKKEKYDKQMAKLKEQFDKEHLKQWEQYEEEKEKRNEKFKEEKAKLREMFSKASQDQNKKNELNKHMERERVEFERENARQRDRFEKGKSKRKQRYDEAKERKKDNYVKDKTRQKENYDKEKERHKEQYEKKKTRQRTQFENERSRKKEQFDKNIARQCELFQKALETQRIKFENEKGTLQKQLEKSDQVAEKGEAHHELQQGNYEQVVREGMMQKLQLNPSPDTSDVQVPHQNEIDELRQQLLARHSIEDVQRTEAKLGDLLRTLFKESRLPPEVAYQDLDLQLAEREANTIILRDQQDALRRTILERIINKLGSDEEVNLFKTADYAVGTLNEHLHDIARRRLYLNGISQVVSLLVECSDTIRDSLQYNYGGDDDMSWRT